VGNPGRRGSGTSLRIACRKFQNQNNWHEIDQNVMQAEVEHDIFEHFHYNWIGMYELLMQYEVREGNCNVPQSHKEDGKNLGFWLQNQRQNKRKGILNACYVERLSNLGVVWEPRDKQWEDMYTLLVQYKEREGHCDVPHSYEEERKNLGFWLSTQRQNKRKGALDAYYVERLGNLGVVWEPRDKQWENMYALLVQYKEREGHCDVPRSHEEGNNKLGIWLSTQRQNRRRGVGVLDAHYVERLSILGVVWKPRDKQWENMYALLVQYKERNGHCDVPRSHEEGNNKLGRWLDAQRGKKKKGVLNADYVERLSILGVVWDPRDRQWENMHMLLIQYKEREGHCDVPPSHEEDKKKLGMWLDAQRGKKKREVLKAEHEKRLNILGVTWNRSSSEIQPANDVPPASS